MVVMNWFGSNGLTPVIIRTPVQDLYELKEELKKQGQTIDDYVEEVGGSKPKRADATPPLVERIQYESVSKLSINDISYDLNDEVPRLYIKGQSVGIVSMTNHYVTSDYENEGVNVITFVYLIGGNPEQKVLSINKITGEVMHQ